MHEKICYKKPFLKEVILRLDFGSRVEAFIRALPQKVATAALQRFPMSEPQKTQLKETKETKRGQIYFPQQVHHFNHR